MDNPIFELKARPNDPDDPLMPDWMKDAEVVELPHSIAPFGKTIPEAMGTVINSMDHGVQLIKDDVIGAFECYDEHGFPVWRIRKFGSSQGSFKRVYFRGEGSGIYFSLDGDSFYQIAVKEHNRYWGDHADKAQFRPIKE